MLTLLEVFYILNIRDEQGFAVATKGGIIEYGLAGAVCCLLGAILFPKSQEIAEAIGKPSCKKRRY